MMPIDEPGIKWRATMLPSGLQLVTETSRTFASRITITEAGRLFRVSTNTIRRRVKNGHLTPFQRHQPGGRPRYFFDINDLVRVFGEPLNKLENPDKNHGSDSGMPRNVPNEENTENQDILERISTFHHLEREHAALKAKFEAQSRHLEDLQRLLTPRLEAPQPVGQRAARYLGELARAFKGENL
tara:strand:- start:373 stop:927 length:555 start_codon:yes stop_codon:yes gene_type:complete